MLNFILCKSFSHLIHNVNGFSLTDNRNPKEIIGKVSPNA
jgi:hypothetical protein